MRLPVRSVSETWNVIPIVSATDHDAPSASASAAAALPPTAATNTRPAASPATGAALSGTGCTLVVTGPVCGFEFRTVI